MTDPVALADYGWTAFFQSQLTLDETATARPARVVAVHRNALEVEGPVATRRRANDAANVRSSHDGRGRRAHEWRPSL